MICAHPATYKLMIWWSLWSTTLLCIMDQKTTFLGIEYISPLCGKLGYSRSQAAAVLICTRNSCAYFSQELIKVLVLFIRLEWTCPLLYGIVDTTYFILMYTPIKHNRKIPYQLDLTILFFSFYTSEKLSNQQEFISKVGLTPQSRRQLYSLIHLNTFANSP